MTPKPQSLTPLDRFVVPSRDLVIVHRVANDDEDSVRVSYQDIDVMIRLIIVAALDRSFHGNGW